MRLRPGQSYFQRLCPCATSGWNVEIFEESTQWQLACWGVPLWGDWDVEGKWGWLEQKHFVDFLLWNIGECIIQLEYEELFKWIASTGKNIPWYFGWWKYPPNTPVEAGHWSFIFRCPFIDQQQHVCLIWSMMSIFCYKNMGGSYAIITFC